MSPCGSRAFACSQGFGKFGDLVFGYDLWLVGRGWEAEAVLAGRINGLVVVVSWSLWVVILGFGIVEVRL